jgi:hypothetical protein
MNTWKRTLTLAALLVAASGIMQAGPNLVPVSMTVGNAGSKGTIDFTLVAWDSSTMLVQVNVSAGDSASVVAAKIAAAATNQSWAGLVGQGGVITFSHNDAWNPIDGGGWYSVGNILGVTNTSGASVTLSTVNVPASVDLQLDNVAAAGGGSTLTFFVTGESNPLVLSLYRGESALSVANAIANYLNAAGPGVVTTRVSPTHFVIKLIYVHDSVTLQTNDAALEGGVHVSDTNISLNGGPCTGLIQN